MNPPLTYHKALVILHWLLAFVIMFALFMGSVHLVNIPNSSPDKVFALRGHMIAGGLILLLMVVRLIVRFKTAKPPAATTGNPLLDKVGQLAHVLLYLLVFAMAGSGIAMSVQANLPAAVFQMSAQLPNSFEHLAPRMAHGYLSKALMALIALHIGAALFHHFVRKDGLLTRMSWRKNT